MKKVASFRMKFDVLVFDDDGGGAERGGGDDGVAAVVGVVEVEWLWGWCCF